MKRVIIEGPDGAGKSTLIEQLRQEFHFLTVVVNYKQDKQDFDTWWLKELDTSYGGMKIPIHDRFYYSELVYGPIIRGSLAGKKEVHIKVRTRLRHEAFLVYCRPTLASISKGVQVNEQMEGVNTHLRQLVDGYDKIMAEQPDFYGDRFMPFDWHYKSDYHQLVKRLEDYLL